MKRRACIVVSSELTVRAFLLRAIEAMQQDYEITLVVNAPSAALELELGEMVTLRSVPIARKVSPLRDLLGLMTLVRLMKTGRFDVVQSMTPKAGLLAMVSAWITRVPVRVHTFTGQVWATRNGLQRTTLRLLDTIVARAATFALADSPSQREFLVRERVARSDRIAVLGSGSVCGVDPTRFKPDANMRRAVRARFGIPDDGVVLLFLGRLTRDKGVLDLARAFSLLAGRHPNLRLVIAGPDEERLGAEIRSLCAFSNRLHVCQFTTVPEQFMAASDILCLPSYREGFGSVIIEAAAVGLPAVASRIYGVVDATVEDRTGLLHEPGNVDDLTRQLHRLIGSPGLRRSLGLAARARALEDFSPQSITSSLLNLYARLIGQSGSRPQRLSCPVPTQVAGTAARGWYARYGKRTLDVAVAALGLVLLLPLMAVLALMIRCGLGSPVLFRQKRPGLFGVPFTLVKFRSMVDAHDNAGQPLPDGERLTLIGRCLRATSMDELPELWNVLTGDMSLVGPRPLLMEYLPLYSPRQARRHDVRPGITGLAQVSGRNTLSWTKRFELDVEYVETCSLRLDLKILLRTVIAVVSRRGVSQPGRATVDFFKGDVTGHV